MRCVILSQCSDLRRGVFNVMKFWNFCDSTSSRVENELKPIELLITDVETKRVTVDSSLV